jgi:hypothetical protein
MLSCCQNKIITYSKNIYSNPLQKAFDIQTMTEVEIKSGNSEKQSASKRK